MLVLLVLAISVLLQFLAAFFAFRLVRVTGKTFSWILISAALFFMGVRRLVAVSQLIYNSPSHMPDIINELVALVISFIMFFGVIMIRPFFMERKRAEDALRLSKARYEELYENAPDMFVSVNPESACITECNRTLLQTTGFSRDEIIGKTIFEIYHPDCINEVKALFQQFLTTGEIHDKELQLRCKDGSRLNVSLNVSAVRDASGKILYSRSSWRDITDRKHAKEELLRSKEQLSNAMNLARLGHWDMDVVRGKFTFSDSFYAIFHTTAEEMGGYEMSINDYAVRFVHPEDHNKVAEEILMALETDDPCYNRYIEHRMLYTDGSSGYIAVKIFIVKDSEGKTVKTYGVNQDITERRRAEIERDAMARQKQLALDAAKMGWFHFDPVSGMADYDEMYRDIFGLDESDNTVEASSRTLHPDDRERVWAAINAALDPKDPKPYNTEFRVIRPDGSARWCEAYGITSFEGMGVGRHAVNFYGTVQDISEHKQIEEELKRHREHLEDLVKARTDELARSRNMLRTLIDSLPDEIYAKDSESRFIMANYHMLRTFGQNSFNDIVGKTDFDLLPKEEAIKAFEMERSVLQQNGQMLNYEKHITDADGKMHWLAVTKVPMRDKDGRITGLVGINQDITYFRESEENLKKAMEEAESANLAKSTFLSSMSHEIRTPMNAILGFSELMLYDENLSESQIKWMKTINRSGEHLLTLINDILEISKIEAGRISFNPSSFDLYSLLHEIEAMFRIKTDSKNLSLLFEYSDELPKNIVTDEGKLRQIIINLVGNAVKFTKVGGVALKVSTKQVPDKLRLIAEVVDTGPGIPDRDINKLFQKFGQTETGIREGGTGLGLAISQQYAKLMNGIITFKSKEEKGSCFTLTIDIETEEELVNAENHKKQIIGLMPGQKQYRILIADDHADNRELLKILVTSVGFEAEEAQDGNEAIAKLKIWPPDLILMDMQMPLMDGYEAIRTIKAMENGKIPIIAVTASAFQEDQQKALDAGADGYLRKPFKEHELFECIGTCLSVQFVYE